MPVFYCKVVDVNGKAAEFVRETVSEEILIRELSTENLYPLVIEETKAYDRKARRKNKYPKSMILEFTDTLSLLVSSGLVFKDALEIAQTIFTKGKMNSLTVSLLNKINKGTSFHDALEEYGGNFPPIYRGMVKVGEKVGSLEHSFKGLSLYLTEEKKLKEKFTGSMVYPAMVLSVAFAGLIILVLFILPRIRGIFSQLGSQIPQRIESLTHTMTFVIVAGIACVALLGILFIVFFVIRRIGGKSAERLDRILLKIPILGPIKTLRESLNFLFAMETLTSGGFSIEDSLLEAGNVVDNRTLRSAILEAREKILKGDALSTAFKENPIFPERLCRWIQIGEKSGDIEKAFAQVRIYYQSELERRSSRFMNLIEPVLILSVGVVIFLFIIFFVIPIFTIYGSL
jgi:type II secretory pathway component PulF